MNACNATEDGMPSMGRHIMAAIGLEQKYSELLEVREYGLSCSYRLGEMLITSDDTGPLMMSIMEETKIS